MMLVYISLLPSCCVKHSNIIRELNQISSEKFLLCKEMKDKLDEEFYFLLQIASLFGFYQPKARIAKVFGFDACSLAIPAMYDELAVEIYYYILLFINLV